MRQFLQKFGERVTGILSGFDRLVFRGNIRALMHEGGVVAHLLSRGVKFNDFPVFAKTQTLQLIEASLEETQRLGRPVVYLRSSNTNKEEVARQIARRDGVSEGTVCVLKCVEPCHTFDLHRDREKKKARIQARAGMCMHLYHYWIDPDLGWMNARIQTWLPYRIQVCLNGREWLARQLTRAGIAFERTGNCVTAVRDMVAAQALLDRQLQTRWPDFLDAIARRLNPIHAQLVGEGYHYYWSTYQSEWASDVLFTSPAALAEIFPKLLSGAIQSFRAEQIMRFLRDRNLIATYDGRVISDLRRRTEGVRVKHWARENSLKMYDKAPGVLRVETTINNPSEFKTYRPKEGDPPDQKQWLKMRSGIADLHRRAEVSQAANERYLNALATLDTDQTLAQLLKPLCRPTRWQGRRIRALQPFSPQDHVVLAAVARGEFAINGLRNRDLRALLYPHKCSEKERRRQSGHITRQLRLLRAHGLIAKISHTHRYTLTAKGRQLASALLQTQNVTIRQLMENAA